MSFINKLSKLIKKQKPEPFNLPPVDPLSMCTSTVTNESMGTCMSTPTSEYGFVPKEEPYLVDTTSTYTKPVEEKKVLTKEDMQKKFDEWYASLSDKEKKNIDKKILKVYLKTGSDIVCERCKKPGGKIGSRGYTLKKVDGKYYHVGDCPKE